MYVIRFFVKLFGGVWKLKELCNRVHNPLCRHLLTTLYRLDQNYRGAGIAWNSQFAGEPCLPHGMQGTFVSALSRIGKNCVIFQQVTIGANVLLDSRHRGAPTVGDNCYIGTGAKIIGDVKIGNNVRIGANCVVYQNVPDNCVVVSSTQTVIPRTERLDNRFHCYDGRNWVYFDDGRWMEEKDRDVLEKLDLYRRSYDR